MEALINSGNSEGKLNEFEQIITSLLAMTSEPEGAALDITVDKVQSNLGGSLLDPNLDSFAAMESYKSSVIQVGEDLFYTPNDPYDN
jgi:hypothetical protein